MPPESRMRYREQYRRCGKDNCRRCAEGPGHGPYWYEIWREHGRLHTRYIGKVLPADALPAVDRPDEPPSRTTAPLLAAPTLEVDVARLANRPDTCADGTAGATVGGGLRILLLGQFRVEIRGTAVTDWRRRSSATLLKLL